LPLNVVLFSGGRGTASIASALVNHDQVKLTSIVNAYDDGLSTGRIRAFVPGMLGPSDIRKNTSTFMPTLERCQRALKRFLDHRFAQGTPREQALANLRPLANAPGSLLDPTLAGAFVQLTYGQLARLALYSRAFLEYEAEQFANGITFDYGDCAVGNLLFAGCYLAQNRDFNRAIDDMSELCESRAAVLNATDGRNYVLVALKEDGRYLADESAIVSPQDTVLVRQIFLLDAYLDAGQLVALDAMDLNAKLAWLSERARTPEPNPRVLSAIAEAELIIYGPGTQHSSLFPTYLTRGISEAIAANAKAEKIFVANIALDHDIRGESAETLIKKLHTYMSRHGATDIALADLMTRAFIHTSDEADGLVAAQTYVPSGAPLEGSAILARNWEAESGQHLGGLIVDELFSLLRQVRLIDVRPYRHMISIVVPMLNEERTIGQVLDSLAALSIAELDVEKEIIVVDGGSTDRSVEIARARRARVYQTKPGEGRGAAIRLGFARARGNVLVVFPADGEYNVEDVRSVVQPILRNQFKAVIGSRSIKCLSLDTRIRYIYGDSRLLHMMGKYGGMTLSVLSLLFYNRYITDPLSTLKGYDRVLIESMQLTANGVDLECEIIAKASRRREFILEVPVSYTPRTRAQGKKTTLKDGLSAIAALFRYRGARGDHHA
jgi:2-phospho-L-lactate transferase/gluconeogenesis factor (CofD/UPF0052 family)